MVALNVHVTHEHYGSGIGVPTTSAARCIFVVMCRQSVHRGNTKRRIIDFLCFVFMQLAEVDANVSFFFVCY